MTTADQGVDRAAATGVALELAGVVKAFATPAGVRRVLDGVDLSVEPGRSSPLRAGRAPARPRS